MPSPDVLAGGQLSPGQLALVALAVAVAFGALDFVWLGYVANDLYLSVLKPIMAPKPRIDAMVLFYALYVAGLVYFVVVPFAPLGIGRAALQGALLGGFAYAVYDLTNLSTLSAFTWKLAAIDMAWGAIASAGASAAGAAVARAV